MLGWLLRQGASKNSHLSRMIGCFSFVFQLSIICEDFPLYTLMLYILSQCVSVFLLFLNDNHSDDGFSKIRHIFDIWLFYFWHLQASFPYKLPVDDVINDFNSSEIVVGSAYNSVVASSLLGGVFILIPVTR